METKTQLTQNYRLKINMLSNARFDVVKLQKQSLQELNQRKEEHCKKMEQMDVEYALRAEQLKL